MNTTHDYKRLCVIALDAFDESRPARPYPPQVVAAMEDVRAALLADEAERDAARRVGLVEQAAAAAMQAGAGFTPPPHD